MNETENMKSVIRLKYELKTEFENLVHQHIMEELKAGIKQPIRNRRLEL